VEIERYDISIIHETDSFYASQRSRILAEQIGFNQIDTSAIVTAVSELAQNIYGHANAGTIILRTIKDHKRKGMEVVAEDYGPGIQDIATALQDGFTTGTTLGLGLPGVKRLMDEFVFDAERTKGTKITVRKWIEEE
jgi:serine/threonine-protein kinase RsbT